MSSAQPKQSALFKDAFQQGQSSTLTPIDITEEARVVYLHFRALGLPDSVTFEEFLSVYTLGLDGSGMRTSREGDKIHSSREQSADVKERKLGHSKSITQPKSRLRINEETNYGGKSNGKWKETLDIVAQRLVGRSEAARIRASISAAKSNGQAPFEDPMKIADDRRESLYRILEAVQKEWGIQNGRLMDLNGRKKELESEIEHKRKAILLLNVLKKREGFRMKRIGSVSNREEDSSEGNAGIGDLMKRLRTEVMLNSQTFQGALTGVQNRPKLDTILSPSSLQKLQRRPMLSYKHSTNALASLHVYHSRLVHMKTRTSTAPNGYAVEGVKKRIEKALETLGVRDVEDTKRRLVAVAKLRAQRRRKFNLGTVTDSSVSAVSLEELQRTNEWKKQEVQQQLNRAIALGWVCEGYVDLIATFCEQSVPALEDSMEEERRRVEGHVDKVKIAILGQRRKASGSFSQRVREIVGTDKVRVWEEVSEDLKYSSPKVENLDLGAQKALVIGEMDVSDISRLLERKAQKAEYGYAMAEEVRGLLQGSRKLKYV